MDCYFRFSFFPRREGNGIRIHFMFSNPYTFSANRFSTVKEKETQILFSFFVLVWNFENRLRFVFGFFVFSLWH